MLGLVRKVSILLFLFVNWAYAAPVNLSQRVEGRGCSGTLRVLIGDALPASWMLEVGDFDEAETLLKQHRVSGTQLDGIMRTVKRIQKATTGYLGDAIREIQLLEEDEKPLLAIARSSERVPVNLRRQQPGVPRITESKLL
jgi:hypothetical protein